MFTRSVWNSYSTSFDFPVLGNDLSVDVAIIGGGITGITTACLLLKAGYRVAVLESRKIGGGATAFSTGNLYYTTDDLFSSIKTKYDEEVLLSLTRARLEAMDLMEEFVNEYALDCDFHRRNWYLYSADPEHDEMIKEEFETAMAAGIPVEKADPGEFPYPVNFGVRIPGQAQFNPVRYVRELARVISFSESVFENSPVESIEEHGNGVILHVNGFAVRARYTVHATHTPKGKMLSFHSVLGPYREYGVAGTLSSGDYPKGIFWGYHSRGQKISIRSYERGNDRLIMAVGEPHKVGQAANNRQHLHNLEVFITDHFDIQEITHQWGGQNYRPADMLPYIGRKSDDSPIFVATGFSTNGLVYGTLAAMIITDDIAGKANRYAKLFNAARHRPIKAAGKFIRENLNVAVQFLKDVPFKGNDQEAPDLKKGEGAVIEQNDHKLAVFRDEDGELHVRSAVCPHLGCIVNWNNAEQTWDCPCHGSRFDTEGLVLEGPSLHPLSEVEIHDPAHKE